MKLTIEIPKRELDLVDQLCRGPATDCRRDEVFFEKEAVFQDGMVMLVQAIASSEPREGGWTQGVLFEPGGGLLHEVGCTQVGEAFSGEYSVDYEGTEYSVTVKQSGA